MLKSVPHILLGLSLEWRQNARDDRLRDRECSGGGLRRQVAHGFGLTLGWQKIELQGFALSAASFSGVGFLFEKSSFAGERACTPGPRRGRLPGL